MAAPHKPVTHLARIAKRKRRSQGDLAGARRRLWGAIEAAEAVLMDAASQNNYDGVLRATHALTQAIGAYTRLFEVGELQARFDALQTLVEQMQRHPVHALPVRTS